jgi:hypothetical protein
MAGSPFPIAAQAPYYATRSLAAVSACTTRAPTATAALAAANIFALTAVSTSGLRIDSIEIQAISNSMTATTAAQLVGIWMWDGTNATLIDEISVSAVVPSTTSAAFTVTKNYFLTAPINVPAANVLYVSTTVTTTASTTALAVCAYGGIY